MIGAISAIVVGAFFTGFCAVITNNVMYESHKTFVDKLFVAVILISAVGGMFFGFSLVLCGCEFIIEYFK